MSLTLSGFYSQNTPFPVYPSSNCSGTGYITPSANGDDNPWSLNSWIGDGKFTGSSGVLYGPKSQQPTTITANSYGYPSSCNKYGTPSPQYGVVPVIAITNLNKLFTPPFYLVTLPAPTFSPTPSTGFAVAAQVSLRATTTGASIYYTTNGTTPTPSSAKYTGSIDVSENTTIKAIAVSSVGYTQSPVASAFYGIRTGGVLFTPVAGKYSSAQQVVLSGPNSSVPIYYTTDGTNPTVTSKLYTAPIPVTKTTTIRAFALAEGFEPSNILSAVYTIGP